jgi:hypothetical protein
VTRQTFSSIVGSSKPVVYLSSHRKLFSQLGAIVSLGTAAIVGIATLRVTPERSAVTTVPIQTEITQASNAETAIASKAITTPKIPTESPIGPFGFSLDSADQSVPKPPLIVEKKRLAAPEPESMPSPAQVLVTEAPQPSPEPTEIRKEFVDIAVELKIQDGRVVEANVGKRQPGAEAFEATALHIARQRRYPPGTSRMETVVLRVANRLGRKEP